MTQPYVSSIFREPEVLRTPSFELKEDEIRTKEIQDLIKVLVDECMKKQYLWFSPQNFVWLNTYPSIILWMPVDHNCNRIPNSFPTVIINPKITSYEWSFLRTDACAGIHMFENNSTDGDIVAMFVEKYRPDNIMFEGFDIQWNPIKQKFMWVEAHALHHELEHTQGILMTDGHNWNISLIEVEWAFFLMFSSDVEKYTQGYSITSEIRFDDISKLRISTSRADLTNLIVATKEGDQKIESFIKYNS